MWCLGVGWVGGREALQLEPNSLQLSHTATRVVPPCGIGERGVRFLGGGGVEPAAAPLGARCSQIAHPALCSLASRTALCSLASHAAHAWSLPLQGRPCSDPVCPAGARRPARHLPAGHPRPSHHCQERRRQLWRGGRGREHCWGRPPQGQRQRWEEVGHREEGGADVCAGSAGDLRAAGGRCVAAHSWGALRAEQEQTDIQHCALPSSLDFLCPWVLRKWNAACSVSPHGTNAGCTLPGSVGAPCTCWPHPLCASSSSAPPCPPPVCSP